MTMCCQPMSGYGPPLNSQPPTAQQLPWYVDTSTSAGRLFYWNGVSWIQVAPGAKGDQGIQGPPGNNGLQGIQGIPGSITPLVVSAPLQGLGTAASPLSIDLATLRSFILSTEFANNIITAADCAAFNQKLQVCNTIE